MMCNTKIEPFGTSTVLRNQFFLFIIIKKCSIHNIFIILSQQIISDWLLLKVTSRQKINFNSEFILEPITTYLKV